MVLTRNPQTRLVMLAIGLAVVIVLAYPAWSRLQSHLASQRLRQALRQGDLAAASEHLQGLKAKGHDQAEVAYMSAVIHRRQGRFDDAFRELQEAERLGWPLAEVTRQRYLARFQAGDIAGTRDYLQRLLIEGATDDVAAEVYETLAKGFLAEFRIDDAAVVLDHWISWRPDVQAVRWRAELYEQDQDWKKAAELYRKLTQLAPGELTAWLHLGDALLADVQVREAREAYAEARRRFPSDRLALLGLAQCARRLGETEEATRLLQEVLASDLAPPFRAQAHSELGQMALEASEDERAIEHFETSLKLDPDSRTHHALGTAYARVGKTAAAEAQFAEAKKLIDRHRRLEKLIREVSEQPSKVEERFEIGQLLQALGQAEKASRWYLTVVHLDPGHPGARGALAEYFAARGNRELADAHRRAARQQPVNSPLPSRP